MSIARYLRRFRFWRELFPERVHILHERLSKRRSLRTSGPNGGELPHEQNPRLHHYIALWMKRPGERFYVVGIEFNSQVALLVPEVEILDETRKKATCMDPVPLAECLFIERMKIPEGKEI